MNSKFLNNKNKKITMIVIIIIIILLLLSSCSLTKNFFGRIGDFFKSSSTHKIDDKKDKEIIKNKDLIFDEKNSEIILSNEKYNISFSYKNINPKNLTCQTSNAEIATCYVEDGYVVVIPKKVGKVTVTLTSETNGKIYKATSDITIKDLERKIELSEYKGNMILSKTNKKIITYNLKNLKGNVIAKSSDEKIASVEISNGRIIITGYKIGNVTITLSVDNNYKTSYKLTIIEKQEIKPTPGPKPTPNPKPSKSDDNNLLGIYPSKGSLNPIFNKDVTNYNVIVGTDINKISFDITKSNNEATVTYTFAGNKINNLNNLSLNYGDNKLIITVKAENGSIKNYEINIKREKSSNNYLKELTATQGVLSPAFDKNTTSYNIDVNNEIDKISLSAKVEDSKSTISYKLNGFDITSLNDLNLNYGLNSVLITVTSENSENRTYTININRKLSTNNYLSKLEINGFSLDKQFNKTTNSYSSNVNYNTNNIKIEIEKEDSKSSTIYKVNGTQVNDLNSVVLNNGDNSIEITVTSQSGVTNAYTLSVHKPVRTISLNDSNYIINMENLPYNISYTIKEDNIEISDYSKNDIQVTFNNYNGTYELLDGIIKLTPSVQDINQMSKIILDYSNSKAEATFKTLINDNYYVTSPSNNYEIIYKNGNGYKNFIINNNILSGTINTTNITNGIRVKSDDNHYIDIVSNDTSTVSVEYESGNNSLVLKSIANKNNGETKVVVNGYAYNQLVDSKEISFRILAKYDVTILANDGFFDPFTNEYNFIYDLNQELDLSEFNAYKIDDTTECYYYTLIGWGINQTEKLYETTSKINVDSDIVLYAIYSENSGYVDIPSSGRLYLTDVNIFHNEDYYEKYGKDKIIYPGARGSHVMTLTNTGTGDLKINGINLEEDTICIEENKCINIGYKVRYIDNTSLDNIYYYGSQSEYKILSKDNLTTYSVRGSQIGELFNYHTTRNIDISSSPLIIPKDESIEISLLWEWADIDDDLDTTIGKQTINIDYTLTVSIDYSRVDTHCNINP